ncbi:MAG: TlpA family protein disulfide reductase [Deltaproteobacteria bacterium]|nr:MAG: TlpA family protein disulfide reductase [Deltaproteobacteria bacterium]
MSRLTGWIVIILVLVHCNQASERPEQSLGFAPDFRLDTVSHQRFYLNQYRGKVVVLLFWTTYCNICKQEKLALDKLHDALGPKGVVVASVCTDPENIDSVRQIIKGLGVSYPTLLDRGARVARKYSVQAVPTTVIVGPEGRLCFRRIGYSGAIMRQIRSQVKRLLPGVLKS